MKAEDQDISMHRTIEEDLFPALRAESGGRWKRMESCELCEWSLEERGFSAGRTKEKQQGKDPRTFEENSQGKDQSTFEGRGHQAEMTFSEKWKKERWRKRKKKKRKKKVKQRKRRWWKKCKEIIISL